MTSHASHSSARIGERETADVAWSYADRFDEVEPLTGYVAFYTDRVDRILVGAPHRAA